MSNIRTGKISCPTPFAFVTSWRIESLRVKCPWCESFEEQSAREVDLKKHDFGMFAKSSPGIYRVSCLDDSTLEYDALFPFATHEAVGGFAWERQPEKGRYCTVGLSETECEPDDSYFHNGDPWPVFNEENCRTADRNGDVKDIYGNTLLSLASRDGSVASMEMELKSGADIDAINQYGWSALHHAAFWGRFSAVKLLLEYGACPDLRDAWDRTASDLAKPCRELDKKREENMDWYSEANSIVQKRERHKISVLLAAGMRMSGSTKSHESMKPDDITFDRTQSVEGSTIGTIWIRGPIVAPKVQNFAQKTVAVLLRRGPYQMLSAISGYNEKLDSFPGLLDNWYWTNQARALSKVIGHQMPPNYRDNAARAGTVAACHVEVKLVTAFVRKHYLAEDEHMQDVENWRLWAIQPPTLLQKATIVIDKGPCINCLEFITKVEKKFDVKFEVIVKDRSGTKAKKPQKQKNQQVPSRCNPRRLKSGMVSPMSMNLTDSSPVRTPSGGRKRTFAEVEAEINETASPTSSPNFYTKTAVEEVAGAISTLENEGCFQESGTSQEAYVVESDEEDYLASPGYGLRAPVNSPSPSETEENEPNAEDFPRPNLEQSTKYWRLAADSRSRVQDSVRVKENFEIVIYENQGDEYRAAVGFNSV